MKPSMVPVWIMYLLFIGFACWVALHGGVWTAAGIVITAILSYEFREIKGNDESR